MITNLHAALMSTLSTHFPLSKHKLLCLAVLITGLAQLRMVNMSHLASHLPGSACSASNYRRLQRFFQFVRLDPDRMALLVMQMLNLERPIFLALDRTNGNIGATDVNICSQILFFAKRKRSAEDLTFLFSGLQAGLCPFD